MHTRENALNDWLNTILPNTEFAITPLTGDASFRRYYRLQTPGSTQIIMDAPPDKIDLTPFLTIGQALRQQGFATPQAHAMDATQGFVLLDDFGDQLLLNAISDENADQLYRSALFTLANLQQCSIQTPKLNVFDNTLMLNELSLFRDWFLERYLGLTLQRDEELLLNDTYDWLVDQIANQPQVFVHRDYHSRNIMVIPPTNSADQPSLGIIDFQDAVCGPFTYDAVSLLKDCYIQWPREQISHWLTYFYEHLTIPHQYSMAEFNQAFDLCGLQRHIRVLGTFCRLHLRDNKSNYLRDLPLTYHYMMTCLEYYKELRPFQAFILKRVHAPFLSKAA